VRDCLPPNVGSGELPKMMTWEKKARSRHLEIRWIDAHTEDRFPPSAVACVEGRLRAIELPKSDGNEDDEQGTAGADFAAVGFSRLTVTAPEKYEAQRPQATTLVGYEFLVTARRGDAVVGSTRLLMRPGVIPPL